MGWTPLVLCFFNKLDAKTGDSIVQVWDIGLWWGMYIHSLHWSGCSASDRSIVFKMSWRSGNPLETEKILSSKIIVDYWINVIINSSCWNVALQTGDLWAIGRGNMHKKINYWKCNWICSPWGVNKMGITPMLILLLFLFTWVFCILKLIVV